ncbi:MAG: hypothetical protein Q9181_002862 [Wetmoreana brouardii]
MAGYAKMKIKQLYIYPIKSLRGIPLSSAYLTPTGIPNDRRYMLFKVGPPSETAQDLASRLQKLTVTFFPQLGLFTQQIVHPEGNRTTLRVTYTPPPSSEAEGETTLSLDLIPRTEGLKEVDVSLHGSPTRAFDMGKQMNQWFSRCLGWEVILVYMPEGTTRPVLGNLSPSSAASTNGNHEANANGWFSTFTNYIPTYLKTKDENEDTEEGITFADCAPYLIITKESVEDVSARLPDRREMDVTKFRPNIVLEGAEEAYEEDFWGAISILSSGNTATPTMQQTDQSPVDLTLTQNCIRCQSLDIDYATGTYFNSDEGTVLKKLMRDRRVDAGKKWSPVFGRYGFLNGKEGAKVEIGAEVVVTKRNEERTTFCECSEARKGGTAASWAD